MFWVGAPNFWAWMSSAVVVLPIGFLWGIFDLAFYMFWSSMPFPSAFGYFVLPFLAVHSFPCWGSVLYVLWLYLSYNNVAYTFTNKRVMMRSGLLGIDYQIIDYDKIHDIQVNVNPFEKYLNVGSILFNTGIDLRGHVISKRFYGIENPYEIFRRIKEISLDVKADLNYPNANRPETNPGYKTKYER
ncbi:MAG: PH domain-containing protein [Planctomycetaceae bacterium]|nr:PH domain-containing protein [Planctomycetaceae bacterium]